MTQLRLTMCVLSMLSNSCFAQQLATRPLPPDITYPEGIAYDAKSAAFYTASAADGTVVKVEVGTGRSETILPAKQLTSSEQFPTLLGMNLDRAGRLWICGGRTGQVFIIDPVKHATLKSLSTGSGGLLNDVAFTAEAAYVTDTFRPTLWRIEIKGSGIGEVIPWLDLASTPIGHIEGPNLNGIVATADGRKLIVGHMGKGELFTIDVATKKVTPIALGNEVVTGIDGLLLDGTTLYLVRQPEAEIVRISLASNLSSGKVTARLKNPALSWPSTLAKKGNELLVVNTQFNTKDKEPPKKPFTVAVIPMSRLLGD